ncbi:hypothetical protein E4U21_002165 [Claviceps maximensis]|nr:hypothetical protein E4U21_002165 [Claviceps maximensis]
MASRRSIGYYGSTLVDDRRAVQRHVCGGVAIDELDVENGKFSTADLGRQGSQNFLAVSVDGDDTPKTWPAGIRARDEQEICLYEI